MKSTPPNDSEGIHPTVRDEAARWLARRDSGLSPAEAREFETWLAGDPARRVAIRRCEIVWSQLDRPLETDRADRVLGQLAGRARRRRLRRAGLGSVAAVALIAGLALSHSWRPAERAPAVASAVEPKTTVPTLQVLPDGSIAELRPGAEIVVDFVPRVRRVILVRGEAHFQVSKNPERPFVVKVDTLEARAVGTSFSVGRGRSSVEVLVSSGRVAVDLAPGAEGSPTEAAAAITTLATIDAGHGVVVELPARQTHVPLVTELPKAQVMERLAWRTPHLEFSGTPLGEATAQLNRHNHLKFKIEDPTLAAVKISGRFAASSTDTFIRLLEMNFDVVAEPRGDAEILLRRRNPD